MKRFVCGNLAAIMLAASFGQGVDKDQPLRTPQLSAEYMKSRDLIRPTATEQSFRKIAWRGSVLHGILDAQKNDKPLLILLMNGHPLGCT